MHAVDTSVLVRLLVRLLVRDDPRQVDAAEKFVAKGAWVSHEVVVETLWVLDAVYHRSAQQIAAALEQFRASPGPGFSDGLVLGIARKAGHLPLGTFDRRLGKLADAHPLD